MTAAASQSYRIGRPKCFTASFFLSYDFATDTGREGFRGTGGKVESDRNTSPCLRASRWRGLGFIDPERQQLAIETQE